MLNNNLKKLIILLAVLFFSSPSVFAGNSGNTTGEAWLEKLGWVSLDGTDASVDYGISVGTAALTGYAWSEKTGWIDFNDSGSYHAVENDGLGNLSGYAWSEKLGWISFADDSAGSYYQVSIDESGGFSGYGWSELGGWINFNDAGALYGAVSTWVSPMQAVLTQQIDIVNLTYTNNTSSYAPTDNSLGLWRYDADRFDAPAKKIFFEAVVYDGTSWGRLRSSKFSLSDNTDYSVRIKLDSSCYVSLFDSTGTQVSDSEVSTTSASACSIKSARVLLKQYINPTVGADRGINATANYINMAIATTSYVTASTSLEHPTYYYYDADLFDPIPNAYLEATLMSSSTAPIPGADTDTGTSSTCTAVNVASAGPDWTSYSDGCGTDGTPAETDITADPSDYLKATNFGFSVPAGATIRGIVVAIDKYCSKDGGTYPIDNAVYIVRSGTIQTGGDNKALAGNWPTAEATYWYGGSGDLWGLTGWTVAHINDDNNFGVAINVKDSDAGKSPLADIDDIRIKVYYTEASIPGASSMSYAQICAVGGACITESLVSTTSESWTLIRSSAFPLSDNTEYELRIVSADANLPAGYANAHLVLYQQGTVDKTEVVRQLINATSTNSGATWTAQKFPLLYDSGEFGSSTRVIYYESTLRNNSSTYGSRLAPGSLGTLNSGSASYTRERSGALNLSDDTEYDTEIQYTDINSSWLLIQLSGLNKKPDYIIDGEINIQGKLIFE